jgi:hypothetical protein
VTDLGVVDPIRVPTWARDRLGRVPVVARLFVALAIADLIARALGILEPRLVLNDPLALAATVASRAALILLPAVILVRRPTAPRDTPLVSAGAVFLALYTLLGRSTFAALDDVLPLDEMHAHVLLAGLLATLGGVAYAVLGGGLAQLNPRKPSPVAGGLANLAAGAIVVAASLNLIAVIAFYANTEQPDLLMFLLSPLLATLGQVGLAYLVRAVIRGLDDSNRLERAVRVATFGVLVWAIATFAEGALTAVGAVSLSVAQALSLSWVWEGLGITADLGVIVLVVAFGLGLADPLRPMAKDWAAPA